MKPEGPNIKDSKNVQGGGGERKRWEPSVISMKTSNLQHILSAMETLTDELSEIDHDWEQSAKVRMSVIVSTGPYSEILKERKRKS